MRCVDVNVLVDAHRPEAPHHTVVRNWLDDARQGMEPIGLAPIVASGFLRIVTHPRIFEEPTPMDIALGYVSALRASPAVTAVLPGERHWQIFTDLCVSLELRGNDVPDAFLAALAIEVGATWVSSDRGFSKYPDLTLEHPARV